MKRCTFAPCTIPRFKATAVRDRKGGQSNEVTDELIMPYKQTLSNKCHSRALDNDVLTVSVITNTVASADHDVPFVQAAIKELQMCLTLSVSLQTRATSGYTRCVGYI